MQKKLSVIIVNYNVKHFIELCIDSVIKASKNIDIEIIVVDNNSQDGSCELIRNKYPKVTLVENKENKGFSKANNQAVTLSNSEYLLFLNPDTVMPEDFLHKALQYLDTHPQVGALGPKLIDGKGKYAPDSKKSFPTLSVAIFKTTGINNVFKKSPYFNKYYAVHIDKDEIAEVEVLSGCCMFLRKELFNTIGDAFDEDYFMYCEDVDLSFRVRKNGYKNIYFPDIQLIHYKGESTKKATLSYIKVFNEALSIFVSKHYSQANATIFKLFINIGIVIRAIWSFLKIIFKFIKTPIFDASLLLVLLINLTHFWVVEIRQIQPIESSILYITFPVYILLWIGSIYINGGYDQPYRGLRVLRGMMMGTIIILAYYGILDAPFRFSRAVILFTGVLGAIGLLGLREILNWSGITKIIRYNQVPKRAVIIANEEIYHETAKILNSVHYAPDIVGRIGVKKNESNVLCDFEQMHGVLYTLNINEIIFCSSQTSYADMIAKMQSCGDTFEYKIHVQDSNSFVGSNSKTTAGDLYTIDKRYNISTFISKRNKRIFDILSSCILLILLPVLLFYITNPYNFLTNVTQVLLGQKTWFSYYPQFNNLPKIKEGVLQPYYHKHNYEPSITIKELAAQEYASLYVIGIDYILLLKNLKFLGEKCK